MSDHVEDLLSGLAVDLRTPEPDDRLTAAVMARVATAPPRSAPRVRWVAVLVLALLLGGLAVSPVGAKVADWLGFHGVVVRDEDSGLGGTPVVPSESPASSAELERAGFTALVPTLLGPPDGLSVSADGRLVSMSWSRGDDVIRIDEFDGTLDPLFWKSANDAEIVEVAGRDALWLPTPHAVVVVAPGGSTASHEPRLAAQTLVVPLDDITVRIEGSFSRARAASIASSLE